MKIKRGWLLAAAGSLGVVMILYTVVREAFGINLGAAFEKTFFDVIFLGAIGLLLLNRKIAKDERNAEASKKEEIDGAVADESENPTSSHVDGGGDAE